MNMNSETFVQIAKRLNLQNEQLIVIDDQTNIDSLDFEHLYHVLFMIDDILHFPWKSCVNLKFLSCPKVTDDMDWSFLPSNLEHLHLESLIVNAYHFPDHLISLRVKQMNDLNFDIYNREITLLECNVHFTLTYRRDEVPHYTICHSKNCDETKLDCQFNVKSCTASVEAGLKIKFDEDDDFNPHLNIHANAYHSANMLKTLKHVKILGIRRKHLCGLKIDHLKQDMEIPSHLNKFVIQHLDSDIIFNRCRYALLHIKHAHDHSIQFDMTYLQHLKLNDYKLPLAIEKIAAETLILKQYNHPIVNFHEDVQYITLPNYRHAIPTLPCNCKSVRIGQ